MLYFVLLSPLVLKVLFFIGRTVTYVVSTVMHIVWTIVAWPVMFVRNVGMHGALGEGSDRACAAAAATRVAAVAVATKFSLASTLTLAWPLPARRWTRCSKVDESGAGSRCLSVE